jgi:hypothetical protein
MSPPASNTGRARAATSLEFRCAFSADVGFLPKVVAVRVASDRRAWTASPFLPCTRARALSPLDVSPGQQYGSSASCDESRVPVRFLCSTSPVSFPLRRGVHSGQPRTMPSCAASGNGSRSEPLCMSPPASNTGRARAATSLEFRCAFSAALHRSAIFNDAFLRSVGKW